jgi:hypothetical protein
MEVFDGKFEDKYWDDLRMFARKGMETCQRLVTEANSK